MRVAVRADASTVIGTGHVMRCLSLADALLAEGAQIRFLCRDLPAPLAELLHAHGHGLLPLLSGPADEGLDADQSRTAAGHVDWWVVDHYALGERWERAVTQGTASRLLAIDDLERAHDCDILLDQNLGPDPDDRYAGLVLPRCSRLLGPKHALLRPEFGEHRQRVRPRSGPVRRLLVFMGGVDADNVTGRVLEAIAIADLDDVILDVVIGAGHPATAAVQAQVAARPRATCHVHTPRMVELLTVADLAIGAGGGATWERCALGVPTLALCIADNQREPLRRAAERGIVCVPDVADQVDVNALAAHLRALSGNSSLRSWLSRRAFDCVDGQGARRLARRMRGVDIVIRVAELADCDRLHTWRNHTSVRTVSRDPQVIELDTHRRWFETVLADSRRHLLIGERSGQPVGVVRFDLQAAGAAEVSIYMVPEQVGQGLGGPLLLAAEDWLRHARPDVNLLRAHVRAGNEASRRLFDGCGYAWVGTDHHKRLFP
jgi:UDP-2,4-diacetamido-2,4,6-trideoxy-beta-L-altropyranose hydrolase